VGRLLDVLSKEEVGNFSQLAANQVAESSGQRLFFG